MIDSFDLTFDYSPHENFLVANTRDKEIILSKIKCQPQKENKLNFEKKNIKDYCFDDKIVKLEFYLKSLRLSNSGKVVIISTYSWDLEVETKR
jgi:hypothetical protein